MKTSVFISIVSVTTTPKGYDVPFFPSSLLPFCPGIKEWRPINWLLLVSQSSHSSLNPFFRTFRITWSECFWALLDEKVINLMVTIEWEFDWYLGIIFMLVLSWGRSKGKIRLIVCVERKEMREEELSEWLVLKIRRLKSLSSLFSPGVKVIRFNKQLKSSHKMERLGVREYDILGMCLSHLSLYFPDIPTPIDMIAWYVCVIFAQQNPRSVDHWLHACTSSSFSHTLVIRCCWLYVNPKGLLWRSSSFISSFLPPNLLKVYFLSASW